ncbi:ADP-heptose:LPS heptosyltransferase, partial [Candidatus Burkholderia humilis]
MTTPLDEVHALTHAGSLVSGDGMIVAPYDLEVSGEFPSVLTALSLPHADYANARRIHLINAFGVTLGDSIVGLTAMFALKSLHPHLTFTIYRPARAPRYVQRLYELATPLFGEIVSLPVALAEMPHDEPKIDIGN